MIGSTIRRLATAHRWDIRAAFYLDVYRRATGKGASYVYLVQETDWPYMAAMYTVAAEDFSQGTREAARSRALFAECMKTRKWPSDVGEMNIIQTSWR